jgi:hypothetical protein
VYWRRRALVAAAVVVLLAIAWLATRGSGNSGRPAAATGGAASARTGSTPGAAPPADQTPAPQIVPATPESSGPTGQQRSAPPPSVAPCGDDQIAVTVTASPSPGPVGGTFTFAIAIANRTDGWCSRDLGRGAQEVQILHDGALLFSSDGCDASKDSDVRAFAAGDAVRYRFTWSSYRTDPHGCARAANPAPPGTYQVMARVGTKASGLSDFAITR